jgi:hypothetical protein
MVFVRLARSDCGAGEAECLNRLVGEGAFSLDMGLTTGLRGSEGADPCNKTVNEAPLGRINY